MIEKSIDEKLFERLMRLPREMRRMMMKGHAAAAGAAAFPPGFGGPHGRFGRCPEGRPPFGPEGRPPFGPDGPKHGPMMPGRRKMKIFMRERLLTVIAGYENGVRQKELTEAAHVNPSTMSELISKLVRDGYVVRTVDPTDKRATLITLTDVGRARAYELEDERNERFAGLFSALTEEEKIKLLELLDKLTAEKAEE